MEKTASLSAAIVLPPARSGRALSDVFFLRENQSVGAQLQAAGCGGRWNDESTWLYRVGGCTVCGRVEGDSRAGQCVAEQEEAANHSTVPASKKPVQIGGLGLMGCSGGEEDRAKL